MFVLDVSPFSYSDPWHESVDARISKLKKDGFRIIYLYEAADSSTFRYRVFNMSEIWASTDDGVVASYFFYADISRLLESNVSADVIVICRCRYSGLLVDFVNAQRRYGARIYYDVDDFVFNPENVHLLVNTLAQDLSHPGLWDFWHAYTSRIRQAMRLCDGAITSTAYLQARIEADIGVKAVVVPNGLNHQQIAASDILFENKASGGFARAVNFQLGYFSGTPSHEKDFQLVEAALGRVMERHSNVSLRVVGYLNDRTLFSDFRGRVEQYPLLDFVNLQRIIALAEVNIVPLQDNIFTNCKSELKFFEAAIVGTATVASPIYSYEKAISHGETGFLARAHEWEDVLEGLVGNEDSLIPLAHRARDAAMKNYQPDALRVQLQQAFFGDQGLERYSR